MSTEKLGAPDAPVASLHSIRPTEGRTDLKFQGKPLELQLLSYRNGVEVKFCLREKVPEQFRVLDPGAPEFTLRPFFSGFAVEKWYHRLFGVSREWLVKRQIEKIKAVAAATEARMAATKALEAKLGSKGSETSK